MGAPAVPRGAAAAHPPSRPRTGRATARRSSRESARRDSARSILAAAALAACALGLTGVDGGLLWIVAGVFTLRSIAGTSPGIAWGVATLGAGLRWGTYSLGDLESATRLLGPTVAAGSWLVRAGMIAVLVGAVLDETRRADWSSSWLSTAAGIAAGVSLVPAFIVPGPGDAPTSAVSWAAAAAGLLVVGIVVRPITRRLPWWLPSLIVGVGLTLTEATL